MNIQSKAISIWVLRIVSAIILLQTLYFKFTGSAESVYIFSQLGMEPYGRIATGIAELVASLLLLYNPTMVIGALLGMGLMSGAIVAHLTKLGLVVMDDGGLLFAYALIVFVSCAIVVITHRARIPIIGERFKK